MRRSYALVALAVSLLIAADSPVSEAAKKNGEEQDPAIKRAGLPYKEGSVYSLVFVRTKPGTTNEYLRSAATGWRNLVEDMKKEGLILSYKVFVGSAANKEDWDVMLLVEYKNMAALDGLEEKIQALAAKSLGPEDMVKAGYIKRNETREVLGEKVVREVILK
jgi:hypothetical protein